MRVKPHSLTISGPYPDPKVGLTYNINAVFELDGRSFAARISGATKRSMAIKMARSIRGRKKWGKIPLYMLWTYNRTLERISEATGLTSRQSFEG